MPKSKQKEQVIGSQNRTVTPNEAKLALSQCIKLQRPIMMWGAPGIGKSDIVKQIADKQKRKVIDIRLPLWEPTDIKGIPYYAANDNVMAWAPPQELPTEEFAKQFDYIVLFLDEMNSAAPSVQAAAYQLILNRRIGQYELPDNVVMIAAGNRETDKGVTYRMPKPLENRFVHFELRVDFEDWLSWAVDHKINPDIVGYLTFAKNDLYNFDPRSSSRGFATPRSWTFVSEMLEGINISDSLQTDLVAGCVGEGTAIKFMAHRKIAGDLPIPEEPPVIKTILIL